MKTTKLFTLALLLLGITSCKDDEFSMSEGIDESYYVEVAVDGKTMELREGKDGYHSTGQLNRGSGSGSCTEGADMIIMKEKEQKKSFNISITRAATTCADDYSFADGLYQVGEYDYSKIPADSEIVEEAKKKLVKVVIMFTDPNGVHWSTNRGSGDQTGSSFQLISHQSIKHKNYKSRTEARFNCKLYNDAGDEMVLTNGRFIGRSVPKHPF